MYTKEDWKVGESFDNGAEFPIYSSDGYELARVFIHNGEQEANAHLISASPDMHKALKFLLLRWNSVGDFDDDVASNLNDAIVQAGKALAKAEGGK